MVRSSDRDRNATTRVDTDISSNVTRRPGSGAIPSNTRGTAKLASGLNILAGLWLILAPWILGYSAVSAALWNDTIVDILLACLAAVRFFMPLKVSFISWINLVLGVWLIMAPFILPYGAGSATQASISFWNDIFVGAAVVIFSIASADSTNNTAVK